jgi:hypothetical protein
MVEFKNEEERQKYIAESLQKDEDKRNKRDNKRQLLRFLDCNTAAENLENDDAKYAIEWILDLYEQGKNMDEEYDDVEDGFYEIADSRVQISYFRLDKIFYYADVRENMDDWLEDFIGNGDNDDINDIITWGCFGMALYILRESYDNQ